MLWLVRIANRTLVLPSDPLDFADDVDLLGIIAAIEACPALEFTV